MVQKRGNIVPFVSESQRKYMYSQLPEIAARWEKETPKKKLPYKVKKESELHKYLKSKR